MTTATATDTHTVATLTIDGHVEDVQRYETAAWFTTWALDHGTYPMHLEPGFYPSHGPNLVATVPAHIVDEYSASLWCGVPFGDGGPDRTGTTGTRTVKIRLRDALKRADVSIDEAEYDALLSEAETLVLADLKRSAKLLQDDIERGTHISFGDSVATDAELLNDIRGMISRRAWQAAKRTGSRGWEPEALRLAPNPS